MDIQCSKWNAIDIQSFAFQTQGPVLIYYYHSHIKRIPGTKI